MANSNVSSVSNFFLLHSISLASDLWSKYASESESRLQDLFSSAAVNSPALILVDDVDAICPKRKEKGGSEAERKIRGALLDAMDRLSGKSGGDYDAAS